MAEHGDRSWRSHTIDRQLQQRLSADPALKSALVVNLGANGMLPADMEFVARDALKAGADAIITNVSIRSFSADFDKAEAAMASPGSPGSAATHRMLRRAAATRLHGRSGRVTCWHPIGSCTGTWTFCRSAIWAAPIGKPCTRSPGSCPAIWPTLTLPRRPATSSCSLFRARARFQSVAFSDEHLQAQALKRTLDFVRGAGAHAIVFYSTENPTQIGQRHGTGQGRGEPTEDPVIPAGLCLGKTGHGAAVARTRRASFSTSCISTPMAIASWPSISASRLPVSWPRRPIPAERRSKER